MNELGQQLAKEKAALTAHGNHCALSTNPYPGRGLVLGTMTSGEAVQIYWVMGRSEGSRNRILATDGVSGRVFTRAADPSKVKDPSLIIYDAMAESPHGNRFVVSNGNQTNAMEWALVDTGNPIAALERGLEKFSYEPDAPIFTPRITGVVTRKTNGEFLACIAILRKSLLGDSCQRSLYQFDEIPAGYGFCVTTYDGDGNPPPPFKGGPFLLALEADLKDAAYVFWDALNKENRVSLATKLIPRSGKSEVVIVNKYSLAAGVQRA